MLDKIRKADPEELDQLLAAVHARYREVHPDWDITIISLNKRENRDWQIEKIKEFLDNLGKE